MFQFKQFTIQQERTPMKVGTDGVLLGAWADIENATRILDIGTGTGLIALMTAQRNPEARIDALEIEPHALEQAEENISLSPWADRVHLFPVSLQQFKPTYQFDSIICNPPFFKQSTKTPDIGRTIARHNDTLPHTELIEHAARLLAPQGNFSVILPTPEAIDLIHSAKNYHLYPTLLTKVLPNPGKSPKRYLIKFTFQQTEFTENELIIEHTRHQYSPEYIQLTKAFYLKME